MKLKKKAELPMLCLIRMIAMLKLFVKIPKAVILVHVTPDTLEMVLSALIMMNAGMLI